MIAPNPKHETSKVIQRFSDPVKFCQLMWPQFTLYDKQREILYSVRDNYETIVTAGNDLGKDFISGMCVLWFFCSRRPCMVMTTSASFGQLEKVLWGEIRRFIGTSKYPLPVRCNKTNMFQVLGDGKDHPQSFVDARVTVKGESMLGMHVDWTPKREPTTLLVVDEASGCDNENYERADTWTHRKLVIGNPYPCANFFFTGSKAGDEESERVDSGEELLHRKVIRIKAEDSPNVRLAKAEVRAGKKPSHKILIPGLLTYATYKQRRKSWDKVRQCIGLDAEFYEGAETLLYPPEWLNNSETLYDQLNVPNRKAKGIGVDPAEGKDSTAFAAVDEYGLIELVSIKTPDTTEVTARTLAFARKHGIDDWSKVCFDRGGGGKQHADRLRQQGYDVRTVGFGESATDWEAMIQPGVNTPQDRTREKESVYAYKNKRAEMYGRLRLRMDPSITETQFTFSSKELELRKQLSPIPLLYDVEGRLYLPPKNKRSATSKEITLVDLIGHSPDEADAVVLGVYAMEVTALTTAAGVLF